MTEQMIDGLQALKNEATQLGIRFHPKIGEAKLLKKINDFRKISTIPTETLSNETKKVRPTIATKDSMTLEEYNKFTNKKKSRESGALVRVQITNLNPAKREWPGEIISVGSSKLGTFKKYIPYNTDAPYHIPRIMLDVMKERKYIMVKYGKTDKGQVTQENVFMPEFALTELPPLTAEEMSELAGQQSRASTA